MKTQNISRTMVSIPHDLKRQVKAQCALDDITFYEAIEDALIVWLLDRKEKQNV